ncbi:hypothetical protein MN032_15655 [Agromyces atrinae]|uniref:hypothetical protein n=1 Tax=Agromyces atrinae TaxID=592376 RepID=UPI001F5A7B03|nr:hypothetical protein [Agromyces atrinae]MCI2959126.1 hypothetical protein [Agromyces atrinae]
MTAQVVDARFAGGTIIVDQGHVDGEADLKLVSVDAVGYAFPMFPTEARALAEALIAAADEAEQTRTLRRRPETDDRLQALDL